MLFICHIDSKKARKKSELTEKNKNMHFKIKTKSDRMYTDSAFMESVESSLQRTLRIR